MDRRSDTADPDAELRTGRAHLVCTAVLGIEYNVTLLHSFASKALHTDSSQTAVLRFARVGGQVLPCLYVFQMQAVV